MSKRDADVDALLGLEEYEEEKVAGEEEGPARMGWFGWLFASCTPKPQVSVNDASRELLRTRLHLDNQRNQLMETYDEYISNAKEHIATHNKSSCKAPLNSCQCNAARTARVHMQNASNVIKQIAQIEQQFSTLTQYSSTLDSMKSVKMITQSMSAANTALSNELRKHGNGQSVENLVDQMSEHQVRANDINQAIGTTFNYATGQAVTGIEIDDSVLAELEDIIQEPAQIPSQVRNVVPSAGTARVEGSRRIRRPYELPPSAEPVQQPQ